MRNLGLILGYAQDYPSMTYVFGAAFITYSVTSIPSHFAPRDE